MISSEEQARDEALTAAGHDPECEAYRGGSCSGCILDNPPAPPQRGIRPGPAGNPAVGVITLTGAAATAYVEYQAAARELRAADALFKQASERFNRAHQAFAEAAAGG